MRALIGLQGTGAVVAVLAFLAPGLVGCGSDEESTPQGSAGAGGSGGSAGSDGSAGPTVSGVVVDGSTAKGFDFSKYALLEGVKVCVYANSSVPCVTTDSKGAYTLAGVPSSARFYVSYEKAGFDPILYGVTPAPAVTAPTIILASTAQSDQYLMDAGITRDTTLGTIFFGAIKPGTRADSPYYQEFGGMGYIYVEGYSVSISPVATHGPFYTTPSWAPDPALTTSSPAGWGTFFTKPGDYTLTFTHPAVNCGAGVTTMVVAGFGTTYVGTACTPADGGTSGGDAGGDAARDSGAGG